MNIPSNLGSEEIKQIIEQNDLIFFLPDLLDKIESVDLFLAIDCLHEMKKDMIDFYVDAAQRMTDYFYFKCRQDTLVPFDKVSLSEQDYIRGARWKPLLHEDCFSPDQMFHGLYQVNNE
jgi:hypothetical protein